MSLVSNTVIVAVGAVVPPITVPTMTLNVATESMLGQDGSILWQTAYLLNDGRIASFGTGNHAHDQSQAMRIIDPVTAPGSVTSYQDFEWSQVNLSGQPITPFWNDNTNPGVTCGINTHCPNYDNGPSMYIPSENKSLFLSGAAVFDHTAKTWLYGPRAPCTQDVYAAFMDITSYSNITSIYNPAVAWCSALDIGVWYGSSGGGYESPGDTLGILARSPSGAAKPWKLTRTNMGATYNLGYARNNAVCVGTDLYVGGHSYDEGTGTLGPIRFFKINLLTKTPVGFLAPWTDFGEYFPQIVYDSARNKILLVGVKLQEYDIAANVWSNVTPANYVAPLAGYPHGTRGVYHPSLNAIFYTAIVADGKVAPSFTWHKIQFPTTNARLPDTYRLISVNPALNPFAASAKHVNWRWHPKLKRVYTWGGDFGLNGPSAFSYDGGTGTDAQPDGSMLITTNQPTGAQTYRELSTSYRTDMYSIDPYAATATVPWRLEHPYLPVNVAGSPEQRPPQNCQQALVYDPVGDKFWGLSTVIRGAGSFMQSAANGGFNGDVWACGTIYAPAPGEPSGSWSWVPSANGGKGTWTLETTAALIYATGFSQPTYVGNRLYTSSGDERIGDFSDYHAPTDSFFAVGNNPNFCFYAFKRATRTYEWRSINMGTRGWTYFNCSTSPVAIVGNNIFFVGTATQSGVRKSILMRVNATYAMALANGAAVPDTVANWDTYTLPFSLSIPIVRFNQGGPVAMVSGQVITGQTSGAVGTTQPLSGSGLFLDLSNNDIAGSAWTAGTATGYTALTGIVGTFQSGELCSYPGGTLRLTSAVIDGAFEAQNNGAAHWSEHAGVMGINGRVVIVKCYDKLVENNQTKLATFNPINNTFFSASTPPELTIAAGSWAALPDTGEVMFGTSTQGYTGNKLWAYKVPMVQVTGGGGGGGGALASYSTSFPATENPLSEGGKWVNGATNGTNWTNHQTVPGKVYATGLTTGYNDAVSLLTSSALVATANQYARGTVLRVAGYAPGAGTHEIELFLRGSMAAGNIHGYEILWSNTGFCNIVRWDGGLGLFTPIGNNLQIGSPVTGDTLEARIVGGNITVYKNGVVTSVVATDSGAGSWATGQPGIGQWPHTVAATPSSFCWSAFTAGNL